MFLGGLLWSSKTRSTPMASKFNFLSSHSSAALNLDNMEDFSLMTATVSESASIVTVVSAVRGGFVVESRRFSIVCTVFASVSSAPCLGTVETVLIFMIVEIPESDRPGKSAAP